MNYATLSESAPVDYSPATSNLFNATIAYDNPEAARHAIWLVDRWASARGRQFEVHHELWRFDVLSLPAVRAQAVADAIRSDLVVVCADRDRELPANVKTWLEEWRDRSIPGSTALVALLETDGESCAGRSPSRLVLEVSARQGDQDFFATEYRLPSETVSSNRLEISQRVGQISSASLGGFHESRPAPHWGINE